MKIDLTSCKDTTLSYLTIKFYGKYSTINRLINKLKLLYLAPVTSIANYSVSKWYEILNISMQKKVYLTLHRKHCTLERVVAQCCYPMTLELEQSGGQGSIPGRASPLERQDKGPRTRLSLNYFCDPSAWR